MICPSCQREIYCFNYRRDLTAWGVFGCDGIWDDGDEETNEVVFKCPECDYEITHSSSQAYDLLNKEETKEKEKEDKEDKEKPY